MLNIGLGLAKREEEHEDCIDVGFGRRSRASTQVVIVNVIVRSAFIDGVENQPGFTWMSGEKPVEGISDTHLRNTGPEYWNITLTNVRAKSRLGGC